GAARATDSRRRHGAPRRLGHAGRGARAGGPPARPGGGRPAEAADRPLLVQVGLLPRAERRALRACHGRSRLRRGRGRRAPRREARPAAGLRAPARADRAHGQADRQPAADGGEMSLTFRSRPAAGEPEGALVLFHGRGADENDLFPLLDLLDPERKLAGFTPRGPLSFPPGGAHWYAVHRIGHPDPTTFAFGYNEAAAWLDGLGFPAERTVIGG